MELELLDMGLYVCKVCCMLYVVLFYRLKVSDGGGMAEVLG